MQTPCPSSSCSVSVPLYNPRRCVTSGAVRYQDWQSVRIITDPEISSNQGALNKQDASSQHTHSRKGQKAQGSRKKRCRSRKTLQYCTQWIILKNLVKNYIIVRQCQVAHHVEQNFENCPSIQCQRCNLARALSTAFSFSLSA